MTLLRLRTEVVDEPGRLGRIASAIAACRGNILGVDVHFLDGVRVADEFLVEFEPGHSGEALATVLRRAGGVTVDIDQLDERALVDPVARAIDVAAHLAGDTWDDRRLESCVAQLVRAEGVRIVDEEPPDGLLHDGPQGVFVLPHVEGSRRRWVIVERRTPRFSSSEVARVAALLRLATAAPASYRMRAPGPLRRRRATFYRQPVLPGHR